MIIVPCHMFRPVSSVWVKNLMSKSFQIGDPPIFVTLRRSARARRLSLRVSRLDGRVTLTLPNGVRESEGRAFVSEREAWLRKHLADVRPVQAIAPGMMLPFLGVEYPVVPGPVRRPMLQDGGIWVPDDSAPLAPRLRAWLREEARAHLLAASSHYAAQVGRDFGRITLRDTRSRWGSCSSRGDLMYSWRLIMAPEPVLNYVAAHEVAHLVEMNHSPAFWAVVERIFPDWRAQRTWLRNHGTALHQLRFED